MAASLHVDATRSVWRELCREMRVEKLKAGGWPAEEQKESNVYSILKRTNRITLESRQISVEEMSAKRFLELTQKNPGVIKSSRVIMPRPGHKGFGTVQVEYTHPILKTAA